jgi:hypothetical protein
MRGGGNATPISYIHVLIKTKEIKVMKKEKLFKMLENRIRIDYEVHIWKKDGSEDSVYFDDNQFKETLEFAKAINKEGNNVDVWIVMQDTVGSAINTKYCSLTVDNEYIVY